MNTVSPEEEAQLKKAIYDKISPRRRKFIDRMGYDNWDPFSMPKDPIEIRKDSGTQMTAAQLIREFTATLGERKMSPAFQAGIAEMALGVIKEDDRLMAMYEFSLWYKELTRKEGS